MLRTAIHLFKVRWKDHLVNYFPLMYHYGINKNSAFIIFSCRIVIISYKMLIITGLYNEKTSQLTIYGMLCQNVTIFYR